MGSSQKPMPTHAEKLSPTIAKEQLASEFEVDCSLLGHPQLGIRKYKINPKSMEAGYLILPGTKP